MNFCLSFGLRCAVKCNPAVRSGLYWHRIHGVKDHPSVSSSYGVRPVLPFTYLNRGIRLVSALKVERAGTIAGCRTPDILQLCERDRCRWHYYSLRIEQ